MVALYDPDTRRWTYQVGFILRPQAWQSVRKMTERGGSSAPYSRRSAAQHVTRFTRFVAKSAATEIVAQLLRRFKKKDTQDLIVL